MRGGRPRFSAQHSSDPERGSASATADERVTPLRAAASSRRGRSSRSSRWSPPEPARVRSCVAFSPSELLPSHSSVAAAGCGGSDDETDSEPDPTAAWASDFCSAVTTWTDELQGITSQFTDTSNLSEEGIQSAADDVKSSTQTLVDDLEGLGAPPTDSGDE